MTSPGRGNVAELVSRHHAFIRDSSPTSPSTSPASTPSAPIAVRSGPSASPKPDPLPLPPSSDDGTTAVATEVSTVTVTVAVTAPPPSLSTAKLQDIGEDSPLPMTNGKHETTNSLCFAKDDDATGDKGKKKESQQPVAPTTPTSVSSSSVESTFVQLLEALPRMSVKEQDIVKANIERAYTYPAELPLTTSWTLFFSDTSATTHQAASAEQYTQSQTPLFVASTVPELCGSLKAYKRLMRPRRARSGEVDTMGVSGFRLGQNLHFFRTGIRPTWEDPWNAKGGRIMISPPNQLLDTIFERLVLLLAGSSLEARATEVIQSATSSGDSTTTTEAKKAQGMVTGCVASRRARGDRIELWLAGRGKREPTPLEFVDALKEVLSHELEMPEVRTGKYKKHFA